MNRNFRLALFSAVLLFAISGTAAAAPVDWESYEVTLHDEGGRAVLIIGGRLPDSVKLPAEVSLTAPKGAELQWAGEVLGGDLSQDISVEPKKVSTADSDIYTFSVTKARQAQIEVTGPSMTSFDGTYYTTALTWTPPTSAAEVRLSAALPAGAEVVTGTAAAQLVPVDSTGSYFSKTFASIKAGEPLELAAVYAVAAPPATTTTRPDNGAAPAIIIVVAIALFGVAFVAIRRKMNGVPSESTLAGDGAFDEDVDGRAHAEEDDTDDGEETSLADEVSDSVSAKRSRTPLTILLAVLGVLVVASVAAGYRSSATQSSNGVISRTYATGDACTQASIVLSARPGVNLEKSADEILKPLETVPGVTTAALYVGESRVEIGYCDSSATEDQLRQALGTTGLVTVD